MDSSNAFASALHLDSETYAAPSHTPVSHQASELYSPPPGPPPSHLSEMYSSPPYPPPLLTNPQILHLAAQGSIPITLPPHLLTLYFRLLALSTSFFTSTTNKSALFPPSAGTELGYQLIPGEKEYLTIRHASQRQPNHQSQDADASAELDELDSLAAEIWAATVSYLYRILVDLGAALGLPDPVHAWDAVLDGCLTLPRNAEEMTPSLLRLFRYEPIHTDAEKPDSTPDQIQIEETPPRELAEPHTDLGLLTLCFGEPNRRGLEVQTESSAREPPPASSDLPSTPLSPPGTYIPSPSPTLLIGATLRHLARHRVRAGVHRVVSDPAGRSSIVFALRMSLRRTIDLAAFKFERSDMSEGVEKSGPRVAGAGTTISAAELYDTIRRGRVNINAREEVRRAARRERERLGLTNRIRVIGGEGEQEQGTTVELGKEPQRESLRGFG